MSEGFCHVRDNRPLNSLDRSGSNFRELICVPIRRTFIILIFEEVFSCRARPNAPTELVYV